MISSTRSLKKEKKNSLSCLHLAIYEAGVYGLFDFVSYPQTQRGLPLLYSSSAKGASCQGGEWGDIFYTGSPLQDGQIRSCDPIRYGNVGHMSVTDRKRQVEGENRKQMVYKWLLNPET